MRTYLGKQRKLRTTPILLTLVTSSLSLPIQAQTRQTNLEEVIVSAQRREENAQEVPISVVVMNQEAISQAQVNSLVDLPQVAPSLNFENRAVGVSLSFSMRGVGAFAPNVSVQPGVGLVVDEIPYSRNVEYDVDLGDVSNVQFLNGPQGTLFGANNIGGVVLITTPQPPREFEGSIEGSVTSDEEYILRASAGGPLSDRIRGRVSIITKEREGYIQNLYPLADFGGAAFSGGEETQAARGKLTFDLTDSLNLMLIGDYRHTYTNETSQITNVDEATLPAYIAAQGNGDPALGRRVVNDPKLINSDAPMYATTDTWGISANLTWNLNDAFTLKSITAYRELDLLGHVDIDASPATVSSPQGVALVSAAWSNRGIYSTTDGAIGGPCGCTGLTNLKQELRIEYSNEILDAVLGGYYLSDDSARPDVPASLTGGQVLLRNGAAAIFSAGDSETDLESIAAFTDVTFHIGDVLDLFAGYRWTEETLDYRFYQRSLVALPGQYTVSGNTVLFNPGIVGSVTEFDARHETTEWAGRAGFLWRVTPDINLYSSVSHGFTGAGIVGNATSPAGAFVEPTTALSYEVGVKSQLLDNRLRMNFAAFKNELEDIQSSYFDPSLQQNILTNAGDFESQGVELDITALIGERLTLNAVGTYMETELTSDVFQPCYFGQTVAQGCVTVGAGRAQNTKGRPGINAPELKYSVGAIYDLPFVSRSFDGRASVNYNWTDERYYELLFDPIGSLAPSYGTLDLTLGITDKEGRYTVSLFGKNVLDEHYITFTQSDAGRNARARGSWNRGSFAYWGVKARFNF